MTSGLDWPLFAERAHYLIAPGHKQKSGRSVVIWIGMASAAGESKASMTLSGDEVPAGRLAAASVAWRYLAAASAAWGKVFLKYSCMTCWHRKRSCSLA